MRLSSDYIWDSEQCMWISVCGEEFLDSVIGHTYTLKMCVTRSGEETVGVNVLDAKNPATLVS